MQVLIYPLSSICYFIIKLNQNLVLRHVDGRHASPLGSYLAACVFYGVLFAISPEGLPGSFFYKNKLWLDLDDDTTTLLQKIAWETVAEMEFINP